MPNPKGTECDDLRRIMKDVERKLELMMARLAEPRLSKAERESLELAIEIASDELDGLRHSFFEQGCGAPKPPKPIDLRWSLATPFGIQVDDSGQVWHSGHVNDVLVVSSGPDAGTVLLASDSGGVWLIPKGDLFQLPQPLSDGWDNPDMSCLAEGVNGPSHVYAACRVANGLFESDVSAPAPLQKWRKITELPIVNGIHRIAVFGSLRRIVLASDYGLFWSVIPPAGGSYHFRLAVGLPETAYFGLAIGPGNTVVTSMFLDGRIYHGGWDTDGELRMSLATISGSPDGSTPVDVTLMNTTSVASSGADRSFMYAVSSDTSGLLYMPLRSTDGGLNWTPCGLTVAGMPGQLVNARDDSNLSGYQGNNWNNAIGASNIDPNVLAFVWRRAALFLSTDGGDTWQIKEGRPHLHADMHAAYFDPTDATGKRIYGASDGGVAVTYNLGDSYSSLLNRSLPVLQFQSIPERMFEGTMSPSPTVTSLIGGGLQDNGNVFCLLDSAAPVWRHLDVIDDGQLMMFLPTGHLLHDNNDNPAVEAARWDGLAFSPAFGEVGSTTSDVVAIQEPAGEDLSGISLPVMATVVAPAFRNGAGQLMYAVAGAGHNVYGLFCDPDGNHMNWQNIASVAIRGVTRTIRSVASFSGARIFVGAVGRVFSITPSTAGAASVTEMTVTGGPLGGGNVDRLLPYSESLVFAAINTYFSAAVFRWFGVNWDPAPTAFPTPGREYIFAMDMDRSENNLFVATDSRVFVSPDLGVTWKSVSVNLPARPHCSDLRFSLQPDGTKYLFLSTYGRSLWRARVH